MNIKIPFKTPSVNHLYGHFRGRKYLKADAKALREEIEDLIPTEPHNLKDKWLSVTINIYESLYYKNGSVRRFDVDNKAKFLLDSVFNALGIDDKFIKTLTFNKIDSECEFSIVSIDAL